MWQLLLCFLIFPHVFALELEDLTKVEHKYLLKRIITPVHYDLYFRLNVLPCFDNNPCSFDGTALIQIRALTSNIKEFGIHCGPRMFLKRTSLHQMVDNRRKSQILGEIETWLGPYDNGTSIQTIETGTELKEGASYMLGLEFESPFSDKPSGFYISQHFLKGNLGLVFATALEPDMARTVFPCFDEPRYKATFRVVAEIDKAVAGQGYHLLSNAGVQEILKSSTTYVTKFKKTPKPFSTYLFAIVLSDFKSSDPLSLFEEKTQKTIEIRHWAPPYFWEATSTRMMNHTLQVVPAIVNHFTELFGIEYKWTKLDQISIPRFEMSAMENPGLLTYKDDVLFPDKRDKLSDMLASIYVVSHELSHQWLGNLVTIEWWRDEWLTEGFATFAETKLQNLKLPGIKAEISKYMIELIHNTIEQQAYLSDQLSSSLALSADVWTPQELRTKFDRLSYGKGAKILTMFQHCIGERTFIKAVRNYLKQYAFQNVQPKDFMNHLQLAVDNAKSPLQNVPTKIPELFSDWFTKPGYPIITVQRNGSNIYLRQERFLSDTSNTTLRESKWYVPITYSTNLEDNFEDTMPRFYLDKSESIQEFKLANTEDPHWYIINNQAAGMYRVNYDVGNWYTIREVLSTPEDIKKIHKYNRAQLVDDVMNIAFGEQRESYVSFQMALHFITYLENERNILPWLAFGRNQRAMISLAANDPELLKQLTKFTKTIVSAVLDTIPQQKKIKPAGRELLREDLSQLLEHIKKPAHVLRNLRADFNRFGRHTSQNGKRFSEYYKVSKFLRQKREIVAWIEDWCQSRPPSSSCSKE